MPVVSPGPRRCIWRKQNAGCSRQRSAGDLSGIRPRGRAGLSVIRDEREHRIVAAAAGTTSASPLSTAAVPSARRALGRSSTAEREADAAALRQSRQRHAGILPAERSWVRKTKSARRRTRGRPARCRRPRRARERSIMVERCSASAVRIRRDDQDAFDAFGRVGVFAVDSGIQTVSRVLCWQANSRTPPGASVDRPLKRGEFRRALRAVGQRNRPLEIGRPDGWITARADFLGAFSRIRRGEGDAFDAAVVLARNALVGALCSVSSARPEVRDNPRRA